jgi:hypothetical protein
MAGIMADNDSGGQFAVILALLEAEPWKELWRSLALPVITFEDLGLPSTAPDAIVWQACQDRQLILVTSNRNAVGPDSLEATLQARNEPTSLPVITIASPRRVMESKAYAESVVRRLLDHLMDLENRRGTGRLWVP